jgi:PilZ domain
VLLDMIGRRLAQVEDSKFETLRRWERKPVPPGFQARIDDHPARILDISYGGLRFEMPRMGELPTSLNVRLPTADLAVRADVVWHKPVGDSAWLCGAIVSQTNAALASEWRGIVDAVV